MLDLPTLHSSLFSTHTETASNRLQHETVEQQTQNVSYCQVICLSYAIDSTQTLLFLCELQCMVIPPAYAPTVLSSPVKICGCSFNSANVQYFVGICVLAHMVHSTHNKSYFDIQLNSRPKTPNVASMYSQIVKEQGCIGRTWGMGEKGGGGLTQYLLLS